MNSKPNFKGLLLTMAAFLLSAGNGFAGTATSISGLYYTGLNAAGNIQAGGAQDAHWSVSYASTNGGASANATYQGSAYVISAANVTGSGYAPNITSGPNPAQWITAPGATLSNGTRPNTGGDFLPGNGNTGANEGIFYYTLSFTITGTGTGTVGNQVALTMTMAADDQYSIYVNPTFNANGTINTTSSLLGGSATAAWGNTQTTYLQNFGNGNSGADANFVIGTNTIVVEVDNTNGINGASGSTALNASGLLVYQVGGAAAGTFISPNPVPELGAWLPVALALAMFGWVRLQPRQERRLVSIR